LAALAASFALGIWVAQNRSFLVVSGGCLAGAGGVLLVGLILLRAGWQRTAVWFALAALAATGVARARLWERRFPPNHVSHLESLGMDLSDAVRLEGRVISTPFRTAYGRQFDVAAERIQVGTRLYAVSGKVRIRVQDSEGWVATADAGPLDLQYGDEIRSLVRLRRPHIYQNPGSFDFRRWMADIEDIYWLGSIKNPRLMEKTGHASGFSIAAGVERARQRLLHGIDRLYPPWSTEGRYGAVLKAVLWGDRSSLDSDTINDFRKTGLYHLLVIAGLHVGLLTLLLGFLLRPFSWNPAAKALLVLLFLLGYSVLVEQRASTLRATLMIGLYLVARVIDRDHSPLNAIGGVALILLYARPPWLFDSGFQLSFAAALLIVGVAAPVLSRTTEPYRRALRRLDDVLLDDRFPPRLAQTRLDLRALLSAIRSRAGFLDRHPGFTRALIVGPLRLLVWVLNILIFSAVLQLGLLLPMAETFHRVTFAGIGLNALAIPVMTVLLALALPINLLSVVAPAIALWPAKLLSLVMAVLFGLTHLPGLASWLSYRVPEPPAWAAWGFCGAFVLGAWGLRFRKRLAIAALAAAAVFVALVALHPFAPDLPHGALEMTVLDCGQGDAFFLVLPDRTTLLVDAGGSRTRSTREADASGRRWDPGEEVVSPYLWSRCIKKIDVVILTQTANVGGFGAIMENFYVGEFWRTPGGTTREYTELLANVQSRGIPIRTHYAGATILRGDASLRVLWPERDRTLTRSSNSDDLLAMRVSVEGASLMLPGAAGRKVEKQLLESGEQIESDVLKVGNRGSRPSSGPDFISRVAPRVAIVSTEGEGAGSSANAETLAALRDAGALILRTDTEGAATVAWKGGGLTTRSYGGSGKVVTMGVAMAH
jgi:competence protein ComEC